MLAQQAGISHWAIGEEGAENSLCEFCEWKWPYRHQSEKWGEKPCGHRTHDPGAPWLPGTLCTPAMCWAPRLVACFAFS